MDVSIETIVWNLKNFMVLLTRFSLSFSSLFSLSFCSHFIRALYSVIDSLSHMVSPFRCTQSWLRNVGYHNTLSILSDEVFSLSTDVSADRRNPVSLKSSECGAIWRIKFVDCKTKRHFLMIHFVKTDSQSFVVPLWNALSVKGWIATMKWKLLSFYHISKYQQNWFGFILLFCL